MLLRVGRPALIGDFSRYVERFDLLEVSAEPGKKPRNPRLREWRSAAPDDFVFVVVLPPSFGRLEPTAAERETVAELVERLEARLLLLRTPPTVRPSKRTTDRLAATVQSLSGARVAWEPAGLFDAEASAAAAKDLDLLVVQDLSRDEPLPGTECYTRIKTMGRGGSVSTSVADRLVDRLEGREAAYVIIDGRGAFGVAQELRSVLVEGNELS